LFWLCCWQVRIELYDRKQTKFISAHNTPLVCLTLSMDGKRLATASDKGTLVRVWNTADGQLLQVRWQCAATTFAFSSCVTGTSIGVM
jgi:WD40 repeat protein